MINHYSLYFYIGLFLITHITIYGFYLCTSNGLANKTIYLQLRRFVPCALLVAVPIYLWDCSGLPLHLLFPYAIVLFAWMVTYSLTYWISYHENTTFIDNHYDIAVSTYLFGCSLCLHLLLLQFFAQSLFVTGLMALLLTALMILPVIQWIYFLYYQTPVSEAACVALLQTNPREAREFISQNIHPAAFLAVLAFFGVLAAGFYHSLLINTVPASLSPAQLGLSAVILIITGSYNMKAFFRTGAIWAYREAKDYFTCIRLFSQYHSSTLENLQVELPKTRFDKPHTIIMVIGESASRYYMSAYRDTENDTTPWMRQKASDPDFILFRHAYSCWRQTVMALERALTEKNQFNKKDFNRCATLIDLARAAGYTTHWYSNQGIISCADTPITVIGKTADHSKWIQEDIANTSTKIYDTGLLPYLEKVDPAKNNFVVLHLKGSHDNFINRYPKEFSRWGDPDKCQPVIDYDNSLAFTDCFLESVFNYAKENLNLQSMVYFSDHGENPLKRRHPDRFDFISLRIPLFLYLSPEYRSLYPETSATLRSHEYSYFTNDFIYEMMAGILNLRSNRYNPDDSLASPDYPYRCEDLAICDGDIPLADDLDELRDQKD